MENLEGLSAKELKNIATQRGLIPGVDFQPNANVQDMLKILNAEGTPEGTPEGESEGTPEAEENNEGTDVDLDLDNEELKEEEKSSEIDPGKLEFEVITTIKRNGIVYIKGEKISFSEVTKEVESLVKDGIIV